MDKFYSQVIEQLKKAQDVDHDQRERAREADLFTHKRDGQWEQKWWNTNEGRPRYTFDITTPIVRQIAGEIRKADFGIDVSPAGGAATKELAKTINGIVRNIQNISNAEDVYKDAAKQMVNSGISGWRVVQKYLDNDSFDQDLVIEPIYNFKDRVWFNEATQEKAAEDATLCFVMQTITPDEYEEKWPEGSKESVSVDRSRSSYFNVPDTLVIGEVYYFKEKKRELVKMSNGKVYPDDDNFKKVKDELAELGITEKDRRSVPRKVVYTRKFDGGGWLEEESETVFTNMLPVVPLYGNYEIIENKVTYFGAVEKLLDAQRVFNYSMSREVEEGALAPRQKYWMTRNQAEGEEATLATLNTNSDPVQFYTPDQEAPGAPQQSGGAQINPGLRTMSMAMSEIVTQAANLFAPSMGNNPNAQSGIAIKRLQDKGDIGTVEYFASLERAITKTARVIVDAIPDVYTPGRQVRIIGEDGETDIITLGEEVFDTETQKTVILNDLSVGKYDVVCSSGPSFQNRQQETVDAMIEIANVDPSILQLGGDILLNNIASPGMGQMADRKRAQLFQQGLIPFDQMNEQEKQQYQQMQAMQSQQGQQPDPLMVAAQAALIEAQDKQANTQVRMQIEQGKFALSQQDSARKDAELNDKIKSNQIEQMLKVQQMQIDQNKAIISEITEQAKSLKVLREALGVAEILDPAAVQAFTEQAGQVIDSQLDNQ